ncbi:transposase [Streptomyces sp. NPDC007904]|uniref:transposase n=1 Tax=Streptomyces sp. NPDC007904 TaxID=3364787 RepID=UPI0036E4BD27
MPATPPCPTWNKPPVNTRSPSPGRCGATPPGNTAGPRASPGTTSTSTTTASRSPAPRDRSARAGTAPTRRPRPPRPLIVSRFTKSQCRPCPARTQCTTTADSARTVGFPPRELRDLQLRVRTEQQTPEWKARYAVRSGVEGTVNEFAHGHGMRRCRYRGQGKAHVQHVLTAIAVNIERLSGLSPAEEASTARRPTAFQNYLDQREIPRLKSWRILGT